MATSKIANIPTIIDYGKIDNWTYRKWSNGFVEAWTNYNAGSIAVTTASPAYGGYRSAEITVNIPSGIFSSTPNCIMTKSYSQGAAIYYVTPKSATSIGFMLGGAASSLTLTDQKFAIYCWL